MKNDGRLRFCDRVSAAVCQQEICSFHWNLSSQQVFWPTLPEQPDLIVSDFKVDFLPSRLSKDVNFRIRLFFRYD